MQVKKKLITKHNGRDIWMISLTNDVGTIVNIINYGAIVKDILMPDVNGAITNLVLTYDEVGDYFNDPHYLGCVVGRYANRISGGSLKIGDKLYQLSINEADNDNHLHGGFQGFSKKVWKIDEMFRNDTGAGVTLSVISPHLDEGYPGNVKARVTYILSNENELQINYKATTDQATAVNLTNHSYFNLSGGSRDISSYLLSVQADAYTPTDSRYIPYGNIEPVKQSVYDMHTPKKINEFMHNVPTLNYCIDNNRELKQVAMVTDPQSKMQLAVKATNPGLQLYFGNYLSGQHQPFHGICLEPHCYPDSPNHANFPSALLLPGQVYNETTSYQFLKLS